MKYKVLDAPIPMLICRMDEGESIISMREPVCWMSENIHMEMISSGGSRMSRMLSPAPIYYEKYKCMKGEGIVAISSEFPGKIECVKITPENSLIVNPKCLLAIKGGVESTYFSVKNFARTYYLQELSGEGAAFIQLEGEKWEYTLGHEEKMVVEYDHIVTLDGSCDMEISKNITGFKNSILARNIYSIAVLGPGKITLKTKSYHKTFAEMVASKIDIPKPDTTNSKTDNS